MNSSIWTVLVRSKLVILSSLVSIGGLIYVTNRYFHAKKNSRGGHRRELAGQNKRRPRPVSLCPANSTAGLPVKEHHLLNKALDDLVISISEIENFIHNISEIDVSTARCLESKVFQLKKLLKEYDQANSFNNDRIVEDLQLKPKLQEQAILQDEQVVNNENELFLLPDEGDKSSTYSGDSFVSATEFQWLEPRKVHHATEVNEEIEGLLANYGNLQLYTLGIQEYSRSDIPVRKMRTKMLLCKNDADFTIKVHCLRKAFQDLFEQDHWRSWFLQLGRRSLLDFLIKAEKDHADFEREFDAIVTYCQEKSNWHDIQTELEGRQVCAMTFYDIVLDFIIMDAFEDLDEPPYALLAVIQNGWISNSIKETALNTAVWSLLKGKTRMLTNQNAFMSRMYQVSQYLTPVLVWGFLGPAGKLKETCQSFKDDMLGFLVEIFSFDHANYSTVSTLADDIVRIAKQRSQSGL